MRKLIATGGEGELQLTRALAEESPQVREATLKQTKLDLVFRLALEHFVDLHKLGLTWQSLEDPVRLQKTKDLLLGSASRLGLDRLRILLSAAQRWRKFSVEEGFEVRAPSPIQLASFLGLVAKTGPTAASSMWHALLWWSSFKMHAPGHRSVQAIELEPWEFFNMVFLMVRANGTNKIILALFVMTVLSCVRFEHLQRSKFIRDHGSWAEFWCSEGKARQKGSRPGYAWACPNLVWQGCHLTRLLKDFYEHESLNNGFLVPGLELHANDLWEVHEATPMVVSRKMSRARFLELLRGTMLEVGLEPRHASSVQYNRLRRFLPTMGNVMGLSIPDMQSIGNWQEIPDGGGRAGPKPKATMPMSLHYSGQKLQRSAEVKKHLVSVLVEMFHKRSAEMAMLQGLLTRGVWTWPELATLYQQLPPTIPPMPSPPPELPVAEETQDLAVVEPTGEDDVDFGGEDDEKEELSSSETSASASDISADPHDLPGNLPDDIAMQELVWFMQGKKIHIVCDTVESQRYVPWCRENPFHQEFTREGRGFGSLDANSVCKRCLARMPRGLYTAIADFAGWIA